MPKYTPSAVLNSATETQPLPVGSYAVEIYEAETITTKAGDPRLKIVFKVTGDAEHGGKKVFDGFNLPTPEKPMRRVAVEVLASLLNAVGDDDEFDTDSPDLAEDLISRLTDKQLMIDVDHRTGSDGKIYPQVARNGYHKAEKSAPVATATVSKPKAPKPAPKGETWEDDIPF